jgi:hypothetical protein
MVMKMNSPAKPDHSPRFTFIPFVFKDITNFENLLFDNRMVLFNRERALRTGSAPMENCRRRQSSSISVLLPTGAITTQA